MAGPPSVITARSRPLVLPVLIRAGRLARASKRDPYSVAMPPADHLKHEIAVRPATPADLDALVALENEVFRGDQMSRRSFRRFLGSPLAATIVAELRGKLAGYALVLFRSGRAAARLYSIAVAPHAGGRRIGATLLGAAEQAAIARGTSVLRLEVHEANPAAIALYKKAGYREFGRHHEYYEDKGHALRFEKRLAPDLARLAAAPPYFHQTTEFTCGPACMLMALAWADPHLRPGPALEFKLWREATTICMTSGPGGCEPYGLAVTLKRHGLDPQIYVSKSGPYFLDTVRSKESQRVMRLTQEEFGREASVLGIPIHLAPLNESALMEFFDNGAVAIVLVSGYRMVRRSVPHWVFAFGHEGRYVLVHDPAARRDDHGNALAPETYAVPAHEFSRMSRFGKDELRAAVVIRKGPPQ
jgi:ribosomal protein S18 acetylase RimI-like enzyme